MIINIILMIITIIMIMCSLVFPQFPTNKLPNMLGALRRAELSGPRKPCVAVRWDLAYARTHAMRRRCCSRTTYRLIPFNYVSLSRMITSFNGSKSVLASRMPT